MIDSQKKILIRKNKYKKIITMKKIILIILKIKIINKNYMN